MREEITAMLNRRQFLGVVGVAASWSAAGLRDSPIGEWGSPVFDLHFHMRGQTAANVTHLDGAGITSANLLRRTAGTDHVRTLQTAAPGRFTWFCSADPSSPESVEALTESVKSGARGFGEMKYHLATDGPEFRRVYAIAAELRVPILIHFQDVDHFENEGAWSPAFAKSFERMLRAYPQTTFIGHADAFWANVGADYHNESAYPSGPVVRRGITDIRARASAATGRRPENFTQGRGPLVQ